MDALYYYYGNVGRSGCDVFAVLKSVCRYCSEACHTNSSVSHFNLSSTESLVRYLARCLAIRLI